MKRLFLLIVLFLSFYANLYSQTGWFQQNSGTSTSLETVHFINEQTGFAGGSFVIYKTTNGGNSWLPKILPDTTYIYSIRFLNQLTGFACGGRSISTYTSYQYLFKTTNTGENWFQVFYSSASMSSEYYNDVFPVENTVYIAHGGYSDWYGSVGSILKSTNTGISFSSLMNSFDFCFDNLSFLNPQTGWVSGRFFSDTPAGIKSFFKTTNGGINWILQFADSSVNMGNSKARIHFVNPNTGYGVYLKQNMTRFIKTSNSGLSWDNTGYQHQCGSGIFFTDENTGWISGGSYSDTLVILRTTNSGNSWQIQKTGLFNIKSIYFTNNTTGWAVGSGGVIFKTTTGGVTGIALVSTEVPQAYSLEQNYPNPFNPVTKIAFKVPSREGWTSRIPGTDGVGLVTLKVFDIAGREVQTSVNQVLRPGSYEVTFDGTGLNSGIYFYQMSAGNFKQTKKLILLK